MTFTFLSRTKITTFATPLSANDQLLADEFVLAAHFDIFVGREGRPPPAASPPNTNLP